jgi:hypothetical protein
MYTLNTFITSDRIERSLKTSTILLPAECQLAMFNMNILREVPTIQPLAKQQLIKRNPEN